MNHDPKHLLQRIDCAVSELRRHGDVLEAFDRALEDVRLAGFDGLARALQALVTEAREQRKQAALDLLEEQEAADGEERLVAGAA